MNLPDVLWGAQNFARLRPLHQDERIIVALAEALVCALEVVRAAQIVDAEVERESPPQKALHLALLAFETKKVDL